MIKIYPAHDQSPEQRLGSMATSDADKLLKTYTYYTEDTDSPNGQGYQRPPDETRYPKIAEYLRLHGVTPIIISDRSRWKSLFPSSDTTVEIGIDEALEHLTQTNSSREIVASVIDGQHRFNGALRLLPRQIDVEIPFLLLTNLSWPEEVERFNIINTTAKNLPKALVEVNRLTTFVPEGATNREVQRQQVSEVILALETDLDSVWHEQINMTGGRNTNRPVTFEGLRRSSEATFAGRLALLPLEAKKRLAKSYWRAVSETWPEAWNNAPITVDRVNILTGETETDLIPAKYRIKDLAGVSALAKVGNQILLDAFNEETGEINMGLIRSRLGRAKDVNWIKSRDNADMSAQAGFSGTADMYDMLMRRIYGPQAA